MIQSVAEDVVIFDNVTIDDQREVQDIHHDEHGALSILHVRFPNVDLHHNPCDVQSEEAREFKIVQATIVYVRAHESSEDVAEKVHSKLRKFRDWRPDSYLVLLRHFQV